MRRMSWLRVVACSALQVMIGVSAAYAQLNTQHIKGTVGLKGGSQPPPNIYLIARCSIATAPTK
jgi:hypothetical protein